MSCNPSVNTIAFFCSPFIIYLMSCHSQLEYSSYTLINIYFYYFLALVFFALRKSSSSLLYDVEDGLFLPLIIIYLHDTVTIYVANLNHIFRLAKSARLEWVVGLCDSAAGHSACFCHLHVFYLTLP